MLGQGQNFNKNYVVEKYHKLEKTDSQFIILYCF